MPTDVIVFDDPVERSVSETDGYQALCMLPLDPGTYLVIAKGDVWTDRAELRLRLEVGDANDEVSVSFGAREIVRGKGAFCLTVGTNLMRTADDFQYHAYLEARKVNMEETGKGSVARVKIVALAVDSVSATAP